MIQKKYFTLSFDDGLEQDKRIIALLKKYQLKATFNLSAGLFGEQNYVGYRRNMGWMETKDPAADTNYKYVTHNRIPEDEARQVYEGFEIASHAYRHENMTSLTEEQLEETITADLEKLQQVFGYEIVGHAYPYGVFSRKVMNCLEKHGVRYGRSVESTGSFHWNDDLLGYQPTCWFGEKRTEHLLEEFIGAKPEEEPLLFYTWGHGYEMDYGTKLCSWERIEQIFQMVSGRDDIVYCTNKEAFEQITGKQKME